MLETVRGYAAVATGLAEAGVRNAWNGVTGLFHDDPEASLPGRVQDMAGDVVANSKQNSELIVGLVRTEVDRAVGRLGFVREEELAAVRRHVERLEKQLADARTPTRAKRSGGASRPAAAPARRAATAKDPAPSRGDSATETGATDASVTDGGATDTSATDASATDVGVTDASVTDGGATDGQAADATGAGDEGGRAQE